MIDDVSKRKTSRAVRIEHSRPVAAILPVEGHAVQLWGSLIGTVKIVSGTDLTAPSGEVWKADS